MRRTRVMPILLLEDGGLVKGTEFKRREYVGDPMNAVRIFSDKEVDELVFLDISATAERRGPDLDLVTRIAEECYVPFCVGGGIRTLEDATKVLQAGAEKVAINTAAFERPELISEIRDSFGSQSVVVSIDVAKSMFGGYHVRTHSGTQKTRTDPVEWAVQAAAAGAGELLLTAIHRDGTREGMDLNLIRAVAEPTSIPLIAAGGIGSLTHLAEAVDAGADALAAGSFFVLQGKHRAVLLTFPTQHELDTLLP